MKDADKPQQIHSLQKWIDITSLSPINKKQQVSSTKLRSFLEEYNKESKSLLSAYFFLLIGLWMPYGYLGRWRMQVIYWLTLFGCGIWLLYLLFRLPHMITNYNNKLLIRLLKDI